MASPGCLIEIHPMLARKEQVLVDLFTMLECAHVEDNKHAMEYINSNHPDWEWVVDYTPVPFFTVTQANRKFGNGRDQVETTVLHIECAEKDALYMKVLLVHVYENDSHFGKFIPNSYHLTHRAESYKSSFVYRSHTLTTYVWFQWKHLLSGNFGIESIKETNHTEERGK
eukprot:3161757-Ditylum_brightwellii.AAC.1